ncbi:MAG: hypothetical protein V7629_01845 [Motiliproteus sp.]
MVHTLMVCATCEQCGGAVKVIDKILAHLRQQTEKARHSHPVPLGLLPQERAPLQSSLVG